MTHENTVRQYEKINYLNRGAQGIDIAALYQCSMSGDPLCIPEVLVTVAERETCSCQMFLVGAVVENVLMGLNMNHYRYNLR